MVTEYKSKWEKFQASKQQAADEWKSVRQMERVMDVELFLGIQDRWAEDSPHCLVILYKMFRHVAAKGQKEVESIIHQGHWQTLPQLNPHAEGPHSSRSSTPHRGRKDDSVERSLAMLHKAHQKVLAAVSTLEEEVERLSHTQAHSVEGLDPRAGTADDKVERGKRRGTTKFGLKINLPPATLPTNQTEPSEQGSNG